MKEKDPNSYGRKKHVWLNVLITLALVGGISILMMGMLIPGINLVECTVGALALITPALAAIGFESHWITKWLFPNKDKEK